ncbi:ATPase, partial [Gardnerella vaginalis]
AADYDSTTRTAADAYARQVRENLEKQTKVIEGNIQSLKQFETEYRTRLTDFLGQLVAQVSDENTYSSMENQDQQDQK